MPSLAESIRFRGAIHLFGEKIPYGDPDIRERFEKEMMLSLWNRPQVLLWLKRAGRYAPLIQSVLKEEKLPGDLFYVAVVESALRAHASSSKGAVGFWQFIPATARKFGLRVDRHVDERRSLIESTRAACRYIKALHQEFGSYLLAAAAFNMGEFGLKSEIEAQMTRDFFSLYLPLETQRYVFKIAAAKLIMEDPERYGFRLEKEELYPEFTFSKVNFTMADRVPLSLIAAAGGMSFKTLKEYNPQIRGYDLPKGRTTLLFPRGKEKDFKKRFDAMRNVWKKKVTYTYHVVSEGESLTGIAKSYKMSLSSLLRLNRFSYGHLIHPGDRIKVR